MPPEKKRRILIIDDEETLCYILQTRLESFGYEVRTATNGHLAWREISNQPPDLVLLDIRMPDEDGFTFLRKLRSFRSPDDSNRETQIRQLPVIVFTGAGEGMRSLFEQERISAYLTKPIDSTVVKKLIEEILNP